MHGDRPVVRPHFARQGSTEPYDVKETHLDRDEYSSATLSGLVSSTIRPFVSSAQRSSLPHASPRAERRSTDAVGATTRDLAGKLSSVFTVRPTSPLPTAATGPPPASVAFSLPSLDTVRFVALCALWYTSSAMSSNTGKAILARFRYPVTLTFVQFGYVALYCVLFCFLRERLSSERRQRLEAYGQKPGWGIMPATQQALKGTLVMSLFQIAGHVFSSMAIARVPVSTVHTIKALSPLFTVASYALLFRVRYSPRTYTSLFPLTFGVMLACSFDLRANAVGFLCALGSTIVFVSQNIFSKKLLPRDTSLSPSLTPGVPTSKLDKLNLLLYSSGMAFLLMIPIWLYTDGSRLFGVRMPPTGPPTTTSYLLFLFTTNGTVHFAQNLLAFTILASCSPVTYSVASLCKRIVVICIAIISFGQQVHGIQLFGMCLTFFGLWLYNQAKHDVAKGERKRGVAEKQAGGLLPTANPIHFKQHIFGAPIATPPLERALSPTQTLH